MVKKATRDTPEIAEEAVDAAIFMDTLNRKVIDKVRDAFVEVLNRDGDHWILDSIRYSVQQIIDEEFKRREDEMVERITKRVHPSRG